MAAQAPVRPARRRPAIQASGTVATPKTPASDRTATSEVPNSSHPEVQQDVEQRRCAVALQVGRDLVHRQLRDVDGQCLVEPEVRRRPEPEHQAGDHGQHGADDQQSPHRRGERRTLGVGVGAVGPVPRCPLQVRAEVRSRSRSGRSPRRIGAHGRRVGGPVDRRLPVRGVRHPWLAWYPGRSATWDHPDDGPRVEPWTVHTEGSTVRPRCSPPVAESVPAVSPSPGRGAGVPRRTTVARTVTCRTIRGSQ